MKALIACAAALGLSACASPSPAPTFVVRSDPGCPRVTACQLPASSPTTTGDLVADLERAERAWHDCAAQIDMIIDCQTRADRSP